MLWLNKIVDELLSQHPDGAVTVSSGVSPSGTYHLGTLREVLTAEAIAREIRRRGREAVHIHVVDDLDVFRKVPVDVDDSFSQYLGMPLCDVPSPDGKADSYADYFLQDLLVASDGLHLDVHVMRAHQKYRNGAFVEAIEKTLANVPAVHRILEEVSGRKLDEQWSPVQVVEDGRLKNRAFVSIDTEAQQITYLDKDNQPAEVSYTTGDVKLNWRIDWPARWWMLGVAAEPFGRDHATKGGSYDTGEVIVREIFGAEPPYPIPYNFINKTGDTKKMSKSAGDTITAADLLDVLPTELVWFFILRYSPDKLLFFDTGDTLMKLFDEFAELLAKPDKTKAEQQLIELCMQGVESPTVSNIPFSHLVSSYQASLRDTEKTLEVIRRTEHATVADEQEAIIKKELAFIDAWLDKYAPESVTFSLRDSIDGLELSDLQRQFLTGLAQDVESAPADADGEWFHKAIYVYKDSLGMQPKEMFTTLYRVLIGQGAGPRAGWFLSILPREWLVERLQLQS